MIGQSTDLQRDALIRAGMDERYIFKASGAKDYLTNKSTLDELS